MTKTTLMAALLAVAGVLCFGCSLRVDGGNVGGEQDGSIDAPTMPGDVDSGMGATDGSLGSVEFVVGYNFGDPSTADATIDGRLFAAKTEDSTATLRISSSPGTAASWATSIAADTFVPPADAEMAELLNHHTSVSGGGNLLLEQGLSNGTYWVYTYHLENNAGTRSYNVAVQGAVVTPTPLSLARYHWVEMGPLQAEVSNGILTVELRGTDDSLIAGLAVFTTTGGVVQNLPGEGELDAGVPGADAGPPNGDVTPSPVDMAGWTMSFEDTFPGTDLDADKWRMYGTVPSGTPPIHFNNDGIGVNDGFVGKIWSAGGQWYGPGLQTWSGSVYYRAEIKARMPQGNGLGPYFLMWPQNDDWPPEMDIVECPGSPDKIETTWHWQGPGGVGDNQFVGERYWLDRTEWHVYTIEHTVVGFRFWIDGVEQATPSAWAEHNNHTHVMNFGIGAVAFPDGSDWYGGIDETTPDPYYFYVRYVRMWTQD